MWDGRPAVGRRCGGLEEDMILTIILSNGLRYLEPYFHDTSA